jgi:polar amino acid transport system substrate-binding protein
MIVFPGTNQCIEFEGCRTIIVGGDHYFPPYEFLNDNGLPDGYNVELTRAIAKVMGFKVEIRLGSWSDMRKALAKGKIDALQGIVYSAERSKIFDFTQSHTIVHESLYRRQGTKPIRDLNELEGKSVVVQKDGRMQDFILSTGLNVELIMMDTHADALRMLSSGKHDFAIVSNLPAVYLGKELQLSNIIPDGKPVTGERYCYAVKKGNEEILTLISEGLAILKNTGQHKQIYKKWLSPLEIQHITLKKVLKISAIIISPLFLAMIVIMTWNHTLKRKIELRTKQLQQHQQQLIQADKMSSLGTLVSGVAHEINNPNSLILLNTPAIDDAFQDALPILDAHFRSNGDFALGGLHYSRMREEIPAMLSEMAASSKRIKRIVEELKNFARADDTIAHQDVDFNATVHAAVRLVKNSIRKSTDKFYVTYAEQLPIVQGNAQRIEQVVVNLILNACQALPNPEKAIYMTTYQQDKGSQVVLEVIDEGIGIAKKHLPHLTEPFFTTKRTSGGTGLGLSVSDSIVREHEGSLSFRSTPEGGTSVHLTLPVNNEKTKT